MGGGGCSSDGGGSGGSFGRGGNSSVGVSAGGGCSVCSSDGGCGTCDVVVAVVVYCKRALNYLVFTSVWAM